jgi:hypothetical protein
MGCCANCFGDSFIRDQIAQHCRSIGKCDFCGSCDEPLVDPISLRDHLELLFGVYRQDDSGDLLVDLLKSDWGLFATLDNAHAKELLSEIFDDGETVRKRFCPVDPGDRSSLDHWLGLREELKHRNRFFPNTLIDLGRLEQLVGYLYIDSASIPNLLYRARIREGLQPHTPAAMGKPPRELSTHGRANPAGIPYLYLASDADTAISEIRPHTGEAVCVAEFHVHGDPRIVDLCNPKRTISPFSIGDESQISMLRRDIGFLCELGKELSRPVLPKSAHLEYLPSQYLCEFIKGRGFNGVKYGSSVGDGFNIALFDDTFVNVGVISEYCVSRVNVEYGITS